MAIHVERSARDLEIVVVSRGGGHGAVLAALAAHTQEAARADLRLRARGAVLRLTVPCMGEAADAALLRALRRAAQTADRSAAPRGHGSRAEPALPHCAR